MRKGISKLDANIRKKRIVAIVLSVAFVVGIPLTVVGAINLKSFGLTLMIIGIVFCVCGFYGTPIAWTSYGNKIQYKRTIDAITVENLRSVSEIASHINRPQKSVLKDIQTAIQNFELVGFTLDGDTIKRFERKAEESVQVSVVCPNCGGINYCNELEKSAKCAYCGRIIER